MTTQANSKLEQVRNHLQQLGNEVANLAQNHADILASPNLQEALLKFRQAYEESVRRLESPNFTIATLGTTSSGKSTIVNALIGRRIAPIEAGETSGGVLTIKHSQKFSLTVKETENAQWETGSWSDLGDKKIYERIRNGVMLPYHQARQKQELVAPQVTAYIPILPAEDSSLLGLPEGIGIEFVDLPGLKSIQDKDNLKVIQEQVGKAFSLVTLDYLQVDDQHRKRLLEELKKVVEYLQGRTDSMIFILNRVDQRGKDDLAIAQRIERLQLEIQETLALQDLPDIIPLSGRFLYYAQCAWGTTARADDSVVNAATRREFLQGLLADCSSLIRLHTSEDRKLKSWFRKLEDKVDEGRAIDDTSMRKVLFHVYDWSGGKQLWQCMKERIQESFSELVILPTLIEVFEGYDLLVQAIDVELKIRKISEKEELETKRQSVIAGSERLKEEVKNVRDWFLYDVNKIIAAVKADDAKKRSELEQYLKQKEYKISSLLDVVREVETDLIENLIAPVRDALQENQRTYELEEQLAEVVTPPKAKAVAKAYDLVGRKLSNFGKGNLEYFVKQVRRDQQGEIRNLEAAERAVRSLYYAMSKAMATRAEFALQGQAKHFETSLESLVKVVTKELKEACQHELPTLNLDQGIMTNLESYLSHNPPQLPEELFSFAADIEQSSTKKREKVGEKQVTEVEEKGSCFKKEETKTVTKDVHEDIEYQELKLPNYKNMARQWADGLSKGKDHLWDVLDDWISSYLNQVTEECDRAINKVSKVAEEAFDKQLQVINQDAVTQAEYWHKFEGELNLVKVVYQQLKQEAV